MADVTYEIDSDGVAVVTWDLENRSMNVLNFQSLGEYRSIIEKLISDESVKGIVLRSAKDAFIAGADLTSSEVFGFDSVQEDKVKAAEKIYNGNMDMQLLFRSMETSGKPFVAAINGHAFGAGFMLALTHDVRIMREDRGFLCANEMQLGLSIPRPELSLFKHKIPANAFYETVHLSKRWTGTDALDAGIVQATSSFEELPELAAKKAEELAPLANDRKNFGYQKEMLFGENAAINLNHGPAHMLKNSEDFKS